LEKFKNVIKRYENSFFLMRSEIGEDREVVIQKMKSKFFLLWKLGQAFSCTKKNLKELKKPKPKKTLQ